MTRERAAQLIELAWFRNGGCLAVGAARPDIPDATEQETEYIRRFWRALPGYTTQSYALRLIARGETLGCDGVPVPNATH